MITVEQKDLVLFELTGRGAVRFSFESSDISQRLEIDRQVVEAIIDYFKKLGFITLASWAGNQGGLLTMNVEAYDLARRGGFEAQEILLKGNIEKLGLEIDALAKELSPNGLEIAGKIAAIGGAITSVLTVMK